MSVRQSLLAILDQGPCYGYQLRTEFERRTGNTNVLSALEQAHGLEGRIDREALTDILWTITAPEIYDRFVRRCGWSHEQYTAWLGEAFIATFERAAQFEPAAQGGDRPPSGAGTGARP